MIGAISSFGVELLECRRGSFTAQAANEWIVRLANSVMARGVPLADAVIVCDNAPAHSRLELVAHDMGFTILRLGPYSPMLNPIENVWSVVKAAVKRNNRTPVVDGPGVIEQRMKYLEDTINRALPDMTPYLCTQCINHTIGLHRRGLALENMHVGQ